MTATYLLLAGGWSTRLYVSPHGRIGKVLVRNLLFFVRDQPRQSEGDDRGVTEQSKQGTAFLYTVVVQMPWQTAVVITLNSKGEFIDYKEPAASL